MKVRLTLAIAVAAVAGVALAGCTGAPAAGSEQGSGSGKVEGTITFQTWSLKNDKFTPYFQAAIKSFEKKYPKVTVKWVDQPANNYEDKVLQQAESGDLPDVVNLPPEMAYALAKSKQLADLSKVDSSALGDYVKGGVGAYTYDGMSGSYGLPWYLGTELNYWNVDLLKKAGISEPPKTFDEMAADAKTLVQKTGVPMISSIPGPAYLLSVAGDDPSIVKGDKCVIDTPGTEKLVQTYADLNKAGAVSAAALAGGATSNTNVNDFYTGKVAWTTATPNYPSNVQLNAPTILPSITSTDDFGTPPLFVQGISVSAHSKQTTTAVTFANYITNNENQIAFVKLAAGFYPGTKAANANPSSFAAKTDNEQLNASMKLGAAEMDKAKALAAPTWTTNMNTYAVQQLLLAVEGKSTPKQALQASATYCEQNLQK